MYSKDLRRLCKEKYFSCIPGKEKKNEEEEEEDINQHGRRL